jgi:gliding motility-associated-like protein
VTVTVIPSPVVSAGNDITICAGETIILSGSGANTYVWSNGVQNGVPFTPSSGTTTYTVTGEINGCFGTDDVTVTVGQELAVSFTADNTTGCSLIPITFENLTSGNSVQCTWDMGDGTVLNGCSTVTHEYSQTGCFSVTLTVVSAEGCVSSLTQNDFICIQSGPVADFVATPMVVTENDPSVEFTNESLGAVTYEWDFGDESNGSQQENPSHVFPSVADEFYEVVLYATNELGCTDSTVRIIEVQEDLIFYVPNAFTPDSDDFNEVFQPVFTSGFDPQNYNLLIFNRWGEVMFESNNAAVGWDGTYGGEIVKDGTYVWKIEFRDKYTDERQIHTGHVTLLR